MTTCAQCPRMAVDRHHVTYQQAVRRAGGDLEDPRNLIWLCRRCHAEHHSRRCPLHLTDLPDAAYEYASELLGAARAHDRLGRYYAGDDPRRDRLLENEKGAH